MTFRTPALALLPALWLALSGAAMPQQTSAIRSLAECTLAQKDAYAVIGSLTETYKKEAEDGPRHRVIRHYAMPADLNVFGFPTTSLASLQTTENGKTRIMMVATVEGANPDIEAAALATHHRTDCENSADAGRTSCHVSAETVAGWQRALMTSEHNGPTDIACSYEPVD